MRRIIAILSLEVLIFRRIRLSKMATVNYAEALLCLYDHIKQHSLRPYSLFLNPPWKEHEDNNSIQCLDLSWTYGFSVLI